MTDIPKLLTWNSPQPIDCFRNMWNGLSIWFSKPDAITLIQIIYLFYTNSVMGILVPNSKS